MLEFQSAHSEQQTGTDKRRRSLRWFDPGLSVVGGMVLATGLFSLNHLVSDIARGHGQVSLAQPATGLASPKWLLVARTDSFDVRVSGIDLQPKSDLLDAIMRQLPQEIETLRAAHDTPQTAPERIDITYQRLASAGPLESLLRSERLIGPDGQTTLSHATSLFNALRPDAVDMRHLFRAGPAITERLDERLCAEIRTQKAFRLGRNAVFSCDDHELIRFFDGAPGAFIRSDRPNQIGGIRFYFDTGKIGPTEEGRYVVTLPQSAFRAYVRPAYRGLFGGEPSGLE